MLLVHLGRRIDAARLKRRGLIDRDRLEMPVAPWAARLEASAYDQLVRIDGETAAILHVCDRIPRILPRTESS